MRSTARWMVAAVLVGAMVLSLSGCKNWPRRRGAGAGTGTGPEALGEPAITDVGLPGREGFAAGTLASNQFETVLFAYDSAQIEESERGKIETVAEYLRANSRLGIILEGHCDERGSNEYNMSLGERRALAVRSYLMNLGIDNARIQTVSYGEERPKDPGHNEAAWRLNRRVEFVTVQQ